MSKSILVLNTKPKKKSYSFGKKSRKKISKALEKGKKVNLEENSLTGDVLIEFTIKKRKGSFILEHSSNVGGSGEDSQIEGSEETFDSLKDVEHEIGVLTCTTKFYA